MLKLHPRILVKDGKKLFAVLPWKAIRQTLEESGKTVLGFQDSVAATVEVIRTTFPLVIDPVKIAAQKRLPRRRTRHVAMKLPNAEHAVIEQEKITDYLLNAGHPDNGGKAQFFSSLGFRAEMWQILVAAFCGLAKTAEIHHHVASPHGIRHIVDGMVETPIGRSPMVRTVRIIELDQDVPHLVTAYPQND